MGAKWSLTAKRLRLLQVLHAMHLQRVNDASRGLGESIDDIERYIGTGKDSVRSLVRELQKQGLVLNRWPRGVYLTFWGLIVVLAEQDTGPIAGERFVRRTA